MTGSEELNAQPPQGGSHSPTSGVTTGGVTTSGVAYAMTLLGVSLLIVTLITCRYCPRFVIWNGLDVPQAWPYPEVNRGYVALEQTRRPFMEIPRIVGIIRWRVLMPLIAYVTHMPDWLYLALPHVGCVIVLAFVLHLALRATGGNWRRAAAAAAILGAAPWLFTSMGWLAYFDSWLVLAILIASFVRPRWPMAVAYLLAPWVDERAIFAVPVVLLVRAAYLYRDDPRPMRKTLVDAGIVAALTLPYAVARLVLMRGSDEYSSYYLNSTLGLMRTIPWSRFIAGLWFAHRATWFLIAAAVAMVWATRGRAAGVVAAVILTVTTVASLLIAGDFSRSLAVLTPAAVAGLLWLWQRRPKLADVTAALVLALNLLLPAQHVVTAFTLPIRSVWHEVAAWRNPPDEVNARAHLQMAVASAREGNAGAALHFVENALKLDDGPLASPTTSLQARELATARQVVDAAAASDPSVAPRAASLHVAIESRRRRGGR